MAYMKIDFAATPSFHKKTYNTFTNHRQILQLTKKGIQHIIRK